MHITDKLTLRPDAKGRICLGKLAQGVSSYKVSIDSQNRLILEPFAEVPLKEKWLFDNKEALQMVQQGLLEAARNETHDLGNFEEFAK